MMVYTEEAVVNTKRHITEAMHLDAVMVVEAVRTVVTEVSHITKERWCFFQQIPENALAYMHDFVV
ncbi:unnamed protein product [Arabidopsis thaliana]|uniref:(thale cress) hypothetical protein n=1 Tax=Arabidopsis thaliana TaxID=3702 RepID=A0A7G2E0S3_ARATH|nr:unnamed protein product [Arabidopsis thaliana]